MGGKMEGLDFGRVPDQVVDLEKRLSTVLSPVRPDPEYVKRLRKSLGAAPVVALERHSALEPTLMVILGLALGVTAVYFIKKMTE
jgi:hypothetical protein